MTLRIETLGGLRISLDGRLAEGLMRRPSLKALLVHLAVEGTVSKDHVQLIHWPLIAPERVRGTMNQALHELRKEIGHHFVLDKADQISISSDVEVDALELAAAVTSRDCGLGADLYRGPFLKGFVLARSAEFGHWTDSRAEAFRLDGLRALRGAVGELQARGAWAEAADVARRWVETDPLEDAPQEALFDALIEQGQRSTVLQLYAAYEGLLWREIEIEPGPALKELVESIRAESPLTRPGGRASERGEPDYVITEEGMRYTFGEEIGRGTMAEVYRGYDQRLGRYVAVKVLLRELCTEKYVRRFDREVRSAARIFHPNVVPVFDRGETPDGRPCLVMQRIEGPDLAARLRTRGAFLPEDVRRIVRSVAGALGAAHAIHVVHRDVKPANILSQDDDDRVFLADFGVAAVLEGTDYDTVRLTRTRDRLGHPDYRSPQQSSGERPTARDDIYSLGVVALELWKGKLDPDGDRVVRHELSRGDPHLAALIESCLASEPRDRPSADEVEQEL